MRNLGCTVQISTKTISISHYCTVHVEHLNYSNLFTDDWVALTAARGTLVCDKSPNATRFTFLPKLSKESGVRSTNQEKSSE